MGLTPNNEVIQAADYIRENTDAHGVFLADCNWHLNPVSVLTGRSIVCGPDLFLYYPGIDTSERKADISAMFDKYAELGKQTKWPNVNIWDGFTEDYTDYSAERAAVGNVLRQYLAPLQAGLVSDVDAAVEEFRAKVKAAGLDACREGFREQWADYCEEYNYQ